MIISVDVMVLFLGENQKHFNMSDECDQLHTVFTIYIHILIML